jgi:hypothetical protein|tara:strand:+ start:1844 stop:2104 length:261 start_codon:yes stop_codon:yes gene_type:complete
MEWDLEDLKQSIIQSAIDHDKIMDDTFIESLKAEGFVYDDKKDRWFRLWNKGDEIGLELYKKQPDGKWEQILSGEREDGAFYEDLI